MTANSIGLPVISGPTEATAIGNILVQMIALGEIDNISNGRSLIRKSFKNEIKKFEPINEKEWSEAKNNWKLFSKPI